MSFNSISIPVKCIARGVDTQWEAMCMTFDLAVQGSSFDEVKADLDLAIRMYLESFDEADAEGFLAAIKRPVPKHVQLGIYAEIIWLSVKSMFSSNDKTSMAFYPSSCPA